MASSRPKDRPTLGARRQARLRAEAQARAARRQWLAIAATIVLIVLAIVVLGGDGASGPAIGVPGHG